MIKMKKVALIATSAVIVIALVLVVLWFPRKKDQNSQQAWQAVLKNCAQTNLLGKNVVYFGASNTVGPGSIWRKAQDGSYRLFFELSDLENDPEKRKQLVVLNNPVGCQGSANSSWDLKLGLPFESSAISLKADVSGDLKKASDITVAITGYEMDELKEGLFEDIIRSNPRLSQNPASFVIASNAIRVTGFSASFTFPASVAAEIRPKYTNNYVSLRDGATLKSDWDSQTTLKLTAPEPFYMLAGFSNVTLSKNGGGIILASASLPQDVSLGNEHPAVVPTVDKSVEAAIKNAVPASELTAVTVETRDQTVVLSGKVPNTEARVEIEKAAKSVPDAQAVSNEIRVHRYAAAKPK